MNRVRGLVANVSFFLCCLLVFLLIFENTFSTPGWLQVVGRMHPLLLHFPIAAIILYAFWAVMKKNASSEGSSGAPDADDILLVGCFTAALSALMGLVLSKEGGYSEDAVWWHKWAGVLTATGSYAWYTFREKLARHSVTSKAVPVAMVLLITLAGHRGANITHGEDFVLAPIRPDNSFKNIPFDEALVFEHVIQPVLKEKCQSCHNSTKAKGELVMETPATILAGGKNGPLWDTLDYQASLLLKRIHLPEAEEEHMPPKGKPQLTDEEKELLEAWLAAGAPLEGRVAASDPNQVLFQIAQARFSKQQKSLYDFAAADPAVVESLNSYYRIISPVAAGSPALAVTFLSQEAFKPGQLGELEKIGQQIVRLSLNKMPVKDEDLRVLSSFKNLEVLQMNFTDISDEGLGALSGLSQLKELAVSGTAVTATGLKQLNGLKELRRVFVWNTSVDTVTLASLQAEFPAIKFESGFDDKGTVIQLSAPVINNNEAFFTKPISVEVKHYLNGVTLRYTLDGSEPDSISSPVYAGGIPLEENATVTVRAFKDGWIGSEAVSKIFLRSSVEPAEVTLLSAPNPKYKGRLEQSLFDKVKGTNVHTDGSWLGYQGNPMDVLIKLGEKRPEKTITLSTLNNTGGWIMPPAIIEIWYGDDTDKMRLWNKEQVVQPDKNLAVGPAFYTYELPKEKYTYLKLHIVPVQRLPAWHDAKGNPGWVFVDEVLLN